MKPVESKLILFLSDPDLSDGDFERLLRLFQSSELPRCISAAVHLRKQTHSAADHIKRSRQEIMRDFERHIDPDFLKGISKMMLDANLSGVVAIRQLGEELGVELDTPIPRSLRSGIMRLLDLADMDKIWSAAKRVRAKAATRTDNNPWPLSGSLPADA